MISLDQLANMRLAQAHPNDQLRWFCKYLHQKLTYSSNIGLYSTYMYMHVQYIVVYCIYYGLAIVSL